MLLALNGATTMRADLESDIQAAHHAGFDLIEIWAPKLKEYLKQHTPRDLKLLMNEHKLQAYSINSIENITFRSRQREADLLTQCEQLCRTAREIGCPYIVAVPSPRPEGTTDDAVIEETVRALRELGERAAWYDMKLAFEFLGVAECSVRTLALSQEIIERIARPNVGLVIDTFHFYVGGSELESIGRLNPNQLFIFHINGAEDLPRSELQDKHRLLPGQGILPIKEIWSALQAIGYDRMASVEIFRPEYWEMDPMELAVEAHQAARRVLGLEG
jgi:2-keto-myo-inositol isomerase